MSEFKPGLEGVVAVETEIAEPDRDGGALRYRGVDIEELVGHVPVRERLGPARRRRPRASTMPEPGALRAGAADGERARRSAGRDGAARRRVEARQAQRDLRRAGPRRSRPALRADDVDRRALGARRRRQDRRRRRRGRRTRSDRRREVPPAVARRGRSAAREGDRHLLDLHRRARPQRIDVHRPDRRLDGCGLRRGALVRGRRALGPAARRRAGVRQADARGGRCDGRRRALGQGGARRAASGSWASGIASTAPRIRARACSSGPRRSSARSRSRSPRSSSRLRSWRCRSAHPDRVLATNVEYYSAIVLDVAEIPPPLAPAMFACSRVAGWSAHILEQKRTGRLFRPSARYVGPGRRELARPETVAS